MKTQIIVIHGGDTFETYDEYLDYLKNYQIESFDYFKKKGWKSSLQEKLGENFDVIAPQMPNKTNAKYLEWKIWFDKIIPLLDNEIILLGHSLGGIFLAKYLAENLLPKKIKALFLVSAPFDEAGSDDKLADFILPSSLAKITERCSRIFLYHSEDDPVVSFAEVAKYQNQLPTGQTSTFKDRGHFNQEEFPEIVEQIKNLL